MVVANIRRIVQNECKRGAAKRRTHVKIFTRDGGELSVDIAGPYTEGVPVTDRKTNRAQWPRYMLVGAFTPFTKDESKAKYEQEVKDRKQQGYMDQCSSRRRRDHPVQLLILLS